jgi:alpha-tubulin suppressor-like RCC1 family protein
VAKLTCRLGRNVHSQLALTPMQDFPHAIEAVALGLDHTLALTTGGYVLSWGQNRFSQLGYVIEQPDKPAGMGTGKEDLEVQVSPNSGSTEKGVCARRGGGQDDECVLDGRCFVHVGDECWAPG